MAFRPGAYGLVCVCWTVVTSCFALPGDINRVLGLVPTRCVLNSCVLLRESPNSGQTQPHQVLFWKKNKILRFLQSKIQSFMTHFWIMVSSLGFYYPLSVSQLYFCGVFCHILCDICRWAGWKYAVLVHRDTLVFTKILARRDLDLGRRESRWDRGGSREALYSKWNIGKHWFWCRAEWGPAAKSQKLLQNGSIAC